MARSLNSLADVYFARRDWARAADFFRRGTNIVVRRAQRGTDDVGQTITGKRKEESKQASGHFLSFVKAGHRLAAQDLSAQSTLAGEMFQVAQWARVSEAAASLAQMAARGAKGDPTLAALARERQDIVLEWQRRDAMRIAAVAQAADKRDRTAENANFARLISIDQRIGEIDKTLQEMFPNYTALTRPQSLGVADVQAELRPDEALILFLDTPAWQLTPEETFIWVVTKVGQRWIRSDLGTIRLTKLVAALRCGLDHALWQGDEREDRCIEMLKKHRYQINVNGQAAEVLPFDLERAHGLYKALLGPVDDMIRDKHLFVVPSGPLTSLPFNVLVTEPPNSTIPKDPAAYRDTAWLGMRQPITVLPSVSSLRSLRRFSKVSRANKPYIGIGNPLLEGDQANRENGEYFKERAQAAREKRCSEQSDTVGLASNRGRRSVPAFRSLFRGQTADIEQVRIQSPLPESADELCEIGRRLGVPESEILLGAQATESRVKDLSDGGHLASYAIVHFATHGALTGQLRGIPEPGLILTPPLKGTSHPTALERDDGFLTASEIAGLKLDAEWAILSACNTAGGSGEAAEALSGLARAFFYAGVRALLVSHWEVGSEAAVRLTTRAFAEMTSNPQIGRAEALRVSMRALMGKGSTFDAHPSQWAPFVVVGEGAAAR